MTCVLCWDGDGEISGIFSKLIFLKIDGLFIYHIYILYTTRFYWVYYEIAR